jgi:cation diffusion facilitator CzcD-associated flavoprotein CzcO
MITSDTLHRYCILGAGTSGLAVVKNFLDHGIPFDCLEREDQLGGNWCYGKRASSIYRSTHLISSKKLTEYRDFPMPVEYPEYPSHELALKYIQSYAEHFGLVKHIEFDTTVEWMEPINSKLEPNALASGASDSTLPQQSPEASAFGSKQRGWRVRLATGEERIYRGVVIANGHNWDPLFPEFEGEFTGAVLHSCQYKTPERIADKRVLVVGGGNSGCDLAVEAAIHGKRAVLSMRRAYPILPKLFRGLPIDALGERLLRWHFPIWLRRIIARVMVRLALGPAQDTGWPKPEHKLFESHPIINSRIHDRLAHGDLAIKPNVARLDGQTVHFVDGTSEEFDVILYATGFKTSFPFLDTQHLNWRDGRPDLYLNIFHPERDDLFCVGLIQPDSGQWGIVDDQALLVAKYLVGLEQPSAKTLAFKHLKERNDQRWRGGRKFLDSPRHRLEVEHFSYRRELQRRVREIGRERTRLGRISADFLHEGAE